MKILIVGCGSIGKRHLRNLLTIGIKHENISCVETRKDRITEVKNYGIESVYSSLDSALIDKNYDAAINALQLHYILSSVIFYLQKTLI